MRFTNDLIFQMVCLEVPTSSYFFVCRDEPLSLEIYSSGSNQTNLHLLVCLDCQTDKDSNMQKIHASSFDKPLLSFFYNMNEFFHRQRSLVIHSTNL